MRSMFRKLKVRMKLTLLRMRIRATENDCIVAMNNRLVLGKKLDELEAVERELVAELNGRSK